MAKRNIIIYVDGLIKIGLYLCSFDGIRLKMYHKIKAQASLCRVSCEVHYRELSSSQETSSTEFEWFHDRTRCRVYKWISLLYPDDLALSE